MQRKYGTNAKLPMVWLDPGTGSIMCMMSDRFYFECQPQIIGGDCPTSYSEKNWDSLSKFNRREYSDE